ncbi:ABC-2 family transporter protein [Pirellulimonas nuda]|uniref:ABC-2 family transporter protein n=1 Tax=Pirellulimonas nuda TaxID=2528009 RepID=A0A518DB47_9BACT|nr:ABC transporter permease subunit/CPBP intramembrane protease [Pirellulimonas nuda]QDU88705.1 ABC-2 family transporter protein [Pirellulimonas nuda]
MNIANVKRVWAREIRDQFRDRRTLFMVAVLPVLMYPILGMSFVQLSQFRQTHAARVLVVGAEQLSPENGGESTPFPPLLEGDRFAVGLFDAPGDAHRITVERQMMPGSADAPMLPETDRNRLADGELDAVVLLPRGFAEGMRQLRDRLSDGPNHAANTVSPPQPEVLYNSAREPSQVAFLRVERLLDRWEAEIVQQNLAESRTPAGLVQPFRLSPQDVASVGQRNAALWSKLLPFLVFIYALVGAFYPAVDLCAGEKERGTLEALLASPASRTEIVCGKLLTVLVFSLFTMLLNLAALGGTMGLVLEQMMPLGGSGGLAPPSTAAIVAIVVALLPVATLFSALSLACASLARSSKEGQYYLMPLMLATMPLMVLPILPGVELNLGTALIPVSGMALVLRAVIEGRYADAAPYVLPVFLVTIACCVAAIRWAVWQFNQESLLFHEGERFNLRRWGAALYRDRGDSIGIRGAVAVGAAIAIMQFLVNMLTPAPTTLDFAFVVRMVLLSQAACILLPTLAVVALLARRPLRALRLDRAPRAWHVAAGVLIAVALHPASQWLGGLVQRMYPMSEDLQAKLGQFGELVSQAPNLLVVVLLLAALPAVCEELAFRGAVLTGLRSKTSPFTAVLVSAAMFGIVHTVLQQSISAGILGLVLGYVALQTGSLWPTVALHATHNALALIAANYAQSWKESGVLSALAPQQSDEGLLVYEPIVIALGVAAAAAMMGALAHGEKNEDRRTAEEAERITRSTLAHADPN